MSEPATTPTTTTDGEQPPLTKKQLKKLEQQRKKQEAKERQAKERQEKEEAARREEEANDPCKHLYGKLPLIQSNTRAGRDFVQLSTLDESRAGSTVLIRARLHNTRAKGNLVFFVLRQRTFTIQCVASKGENVSKPMLRFLAGISSESIIDVTGTVKTVESPIVATTQQDVEIHLQSCFVVSEAFSPLPIGIEDAERPQPLLDEQQQRIEEFEQQLVELNKQKESETDAEAQKALDLKIAEVTEQKSKAAQYVVVSQSVRLDNRILDLRTTTNQAIFKMQSGVCQLFREYLYSKKFTEIHSPKMIAAASEGGADVFKLTYFERDAFLAQSPQLFKQMAIASDFERVFEIGPVFRAEKSNTHRHMTEFTGLDMEMVFNEHYHEVLDVLDEMFMYIFDGLAERYQTEMSVIKRQFPFEPLVYTKPTLRLKYPEAIAMLREAGVEKGETDDINTTEEKQLGQLVKEKYNTDFYILDKFPLAIRPFYTMPDPDDEKWSNSYDIFLRGEEIMSGAQRIHDPELLAARASTLGVDTSKINDYIEAFKYGAPPHAGGGVGLERVVMLYLSLGNIRKTSLFPRTPNRLTP